MRATECFQGLVGFFWAMAVTHGGASDIPLISCLFGGRCLLPCSFHPSTEEIIHWLLVTTTNIQVHSYYEGQDQFMYQEERFKGRTSLQLDQISVGNASLTLTGVTLQDAGKYKCYTSTTADHKQSLMNLKVQAPVGAVVIELVTDTVTCSSAGIYPQPELAWSTSPSTGSGLNQNTTTVHHNLQGLYNISSSLKITATDDVASAYTCIVRTDAGTRRATIRRLPTIKVTANNEVTIDCNTSMAAMEGFHSITWTFNHTQIIWDKGQATTPTQGNWGGEVKGVSDTGSLRLRVSSAEESEGTYTCELRSDAGETYVTNTVLDISAAATGGSDRSRWPLIPVIIVLCGFLIITLVYCLRRRPWIGSAVNSGQGNSETPREQVGLEIIRHNGVERQTPEQGSSEEMPLKEEAR